MKGEKKSKLEKFEKKIQEIYPDNFNEILSFHKKERLKTFRINLLRDNSEKIIESLKKEDIKFAPTEIPNAYICLDKESSDKLARTEAFANSNIYIQNLSSMLPAFSLLDEVAPPTSLLRRENSGREKLITVLDMCAAPGSKTTLIYDLLKINDINFELTAIEKDRSRFFKLKDTLKRYGAEDVKVLNLDATKLIQILPQYEKYFDLILLDAPCSNEASIDLNDLDSLKFWNPKKAQSVSNLQKRLLLTALDLIKPDGKIIYSTCTYSVEENEEVVDFVLRQSQKSKNQNIKIQKNRRQNKEISINAENGKVKYRFKNFDESLKNTVRVIPDEKFEGFFIASLKLS